MNEKNDLPSAEGRFKLTKDRKAWLVENVLSLGLALIVVFGIRSSVLEAFKIPTGSMIPTLFVGDHIFVNKFAYGLKLPFSDLFGNHPVYLTQQSLPKHGDVIVFLYPKNESIYYIKRVVGVPGDTVEMKNKVLYLNQKRVDQDAIPESTAESVLRKLDDPQYPIGKMHLFTEHLDTVDHTIMIDQEGFRSENFGPITIPPESLFVMGDNRDFSGDSRFWGFVPMKNVKGKALFIWMSFWVDFSEGRFTFYPGRIGSKL